jgi:hypothetical protein
MSGQVTPVHCVESLPLTQSVEESVALAGSEWTSLLMRSRWLPVSWLAMANGSHQLLEAFWIVHFTFPSYKNVLALPKQLLHLSRVAGSVRGELPLPEFLACLRFCREPAAGMAMPEAAMHETAVRQRGRTMSGLPGKPRTRSRNRSPLQKRCYRTSISGPESRDRTQAMIRERVWSSRRCLSLRWCRIRCVSKRYGISGLRSS